jgi:hypothetical protein
MLRSIRVVYARQLPLVKGNPAAEEAYGRGLQLLTDIFLDCLVENIGDRLRTGDRSRALSSAQLLKAESPSRWQALLGSCPEAAPLVTELAKAR